MKDKGFTLKPILNSSKSKLVLGFTLIELIIYMALFSIMMGGLITIIFQLIQNGELISVKNSTQEEMNFVLKKIDWALTDTFSIDYPISGSAHELIINKNNFTYNPIVFKLNNFNPDYKYIEYCINTNDCNPITTKNIEVKDLSFMRLEEIDQNIKGVEITININEIEISHIKYLES